jgi:hypothetical protein
MAPRRGVSRHHLNGVQFPFVVADGVATLSCLHPLHALSHLLPITVN